MPEDDAPTFSVEVLSFGGTADDGVYVGSVASAFGIPTDSVLEMMRSAPVRVKRSVDGDSAKVLTNTLLGVGAEVRIINDATGEERNFKPGGNDASLPPVGAASPSPTSEAPPDMEGITTDAGVSLLEALRAAKERKARGTSSAVSSPVPHVQASGPDPVSPSHPLLTPASGTQIEKCSVCSKRVKRGEPCHYCGWSNTLKKRLSPDGTSPGFRSALSRPVLGLFVLLAICAGAAGFMFLGPAFAVTGFLGSLGLLFVADGLTTELRTTKFRVPKGALKKEEKARIGSARIRFVALGIASLVISGSAALFSFGGETTLTLDSFGIRYSAVVPAPTTFKRRGFDVATPLGSQHVAIVTAGPAEGLDVFTLIRIPVPRSVKDVSDEALQGAASATFEAAFPGAALEDYAGLDHDGHKGFQAKVAGADKAGGEAYVVNYGPDLLVVAAFGKSPNPEVAQSFLKSATTQ